jgi:hypothetical protein
MARDPDPLLTVVYPIIDVRGDAGERVRTWTQAQTLARRRYRVVAGFDGTAPRQERAVAALLGPQDELLSVPEANDAALWNAGARRAGTPWLVFTEGHCLAETGCLAAVARWIAANPAAEVGNFRVGHRDDYLLARLSQRWFGLMQRTWRAPGEWPRVHRAGFAIRADVFEAVGGFQAEYGQFTPALLSARLCQRGIRIEAVPDATVIHLDDERMCHHHEDTADFVRGELAARCCHEPAFFEHYFGHAPVWANQACHQPRVARSTAGAILTAILADPAKNAPLAALLPSLAARTVLGPARRAALHRLAVTLDELAVERLPLPARWRWARFIRAHARVVRLAQLDWLRHRGGLRDKPLPPGRLPIDQIGPGMISGVHGLERHDGRLFRWTEPVVLLRLAAGEGSHELTIDTGGIRGDPLGSVIMAMAGGRVLPRELLSSRPDGTLVIRLPASWAAAARAGLLIICSPLAPAREGSPDQRLLGLPIISIATAPLGIGIGTGMIAA